MERRWMLTCHLNEKHNVTVWDTIEGAMVQREAQLKPRRLRDRNSKTGYRMEWPIGWTAIHRTLNSSRH